MESFGRLNMSEIPGAIGKLVATVAANDGDVVMVEMQLRDKRTFRKLCQVRKSTIRDALASGWLRYDPMTSIVTAVVEITVRVPQDKVDDVRAFCESLHICN